MEACFEADLVLAKVNEKEEQVLPRQSSYVSVNGKIILICTRKSRVPGTQLCQ